MLVPLNRILLLYNSRCNGIPVCYGQHSNRYLSIVLGVTLSAFNLCHEIGYSFLLFANLSVFKCFVLKKMVLRSGFRYPCTDI